MAKKSERKQKIRVKKNGKRKKKMEKLQGKVAAKF